MSIRMVAWIGLLLPKVDIPHMRNLLCFPTCADYTAAASDKVHISPFQSLVSTAEALSVMELFLSQPNKSRYVLK